MRASVEKPDAYDVAVAAADAILVQRRSRFPRLREALVADAKATAMFRGERHQFRNSLDATLQLVRLAVVSDAYLAQALYRCKATLQVRGVPLLPRLAHRLAMVWAQVSIGDPVIVAPGVYLIHGQVVLDGLTEIGAGTTIAPFVTIGLRAGIIQGPTIGARVAIGTGAKLIGPITVGDDARIGAGAVVISDVPAGATAVGAPARAR
jgi:serine acetyltransferase